MVGCGGLRSAQRGSTEPRLEETLAELDGHFEARADGAKLRSLITLGEALAMDWPDDPGVEWRQSRAALALAYGHSPEDQGQWYRTAMAHSRQCLRGNSGWKSREDLAGGRVNRRAARRLGEGDRPCLEVLLRSWLRWVEVRGPAAHLDLAEIQILSERAMELNEESPGWVAPWSRAMLLSLQASTSASVDEALALFHQSSLLAPDLVTPRIDALALSLRFDRGAQARAEFARRSREQPTGIYAGHPWQLENQRGAQRLLSLAD